MGSPNFMFTLKNFVFVQKLDIVILTKTKLTNTRAPLSCHK